MVQRLRASALTVFFLFVALTAWGCAMHSHVVGTGSTTGEVVEQRQWYVLWGLVPINDVDTQDMADGAQNYTIETEQSALDIVINLFTSYVSVVSRTVTVTK